MYKIELADGTILDNLALNGNNYISNEIIPDSVFLENLSIVKIINNGETVEHTNMKLIQNMVVDNKSWFIIEPKSDDELEKEMLIHQLAIMSDTIDILFGGE